MSIDEKDIKNLKSGTIILHKNHSFCFPEVPQTKIIVAQTMQNPNIFGILTPIQ